MKEEVYSDICSIDYLESRGIRVCELENCSLGHLSIRPSSAELSLIEYGFSDADLAFLGIPGLSFTAEEIKSAVWFYEVLEDGKGFCLRCALGATPLKIFPTEYAFINLWFLVRRCIEKSKLTGMGLANLILARIVDERAGTENKWARFVADSLENCQPILKRIVGDLEALEDELEAVWDLCAFISGFRLNPTNSRELALLLDWIASTQEGNTPELDRGFPLEMASVFEAIGEALGSLTLETEGLGAQLCALSSAQDKTLVLGSPVRPFLPLLRMLLPDVQVITDACAKYSSKRQTDILVVLPAYYKTEWLEEKIEQCRANGILVVVSFGPENTNNEAVFEIDLSQKIQILGSIHLPLTFGNHSTNTQWSMHFMKKTDALPSDYVIPMHILEPKYYKYDALEKIVELVKDIISGCSCKQVVESV